MSDVQILIARDPWRNKEYLRDLYEDQDDCDETFDERISYELQEYAKGSGWYIESTEDTMKFSTSLDNFDYVMLLRKIGVPDNAFDWRRNF